MLKASAKKNQIQVTSIFDLTRLGISPLSRHIPCFVVGLPQREFIHGNLKWISVTRLTSDQGKLYSSESNWCEATGTNLLSIGKVQF